MTINSSNDLNSYKKTIEKLSEQYAEENFKPDPLLSPQALKEKLKCDFKEQIGMEDLKGHLDNAYQILQNEGPNLDPDEWDSLQKELVKAAEILDNFDYETSIDSNFAQFLGISEQSLNIIDRLGRSKFKDQPEHALSLFVLLSTLEENNPENWFSLGNCFLKQNQTEMALRAYNLCLEMDNNHAGSKAMTISCYLNLKEKSKARTALQEAQKLVADQNLEETWGQYLSTREAELTDESP